MNKQNDSVLYHVYLILIPKKSKGEIEPCLSVASSIMERLKRKISVVVSGRRGDDKIQRNTMGKSLKHSALIEEEVRTREESLSIALLS